MRKRTLALMIGCVILVAAATVHAGDRIYYFHNDHLGTPQAMTDSAGRVVWKSEYDPFGKAVVDQDPDGNGQLVVNNLRFPGQYYDAETGLHYNWFRYYEPHLGRYLQPDPIGQAGGPNVYAYVDGNPVNRVDPDGLQAVPIPTPILLPPPSIPGYSSQDLSRALTQWWDDNHNPDWANDTYQMLMGTPAEYWSKMCATAKNDRHSNQDAIAAAREQYDTARTQLNNLNKMPNKDPDLKGKIEKLKRLLKRLKEKIDFKGETHHIR